MAVIYNAETDETTEGKLEGKCEICGSSEKTFYTLTVKGGLVCSDCQQNTNSNKEGCDAVHQKKG